MIIWEGPACLISIQNLAFFTGALLGVESFVFYRLSVRNQRQVVSGTDLENHRPPHRSPHGSLASEKKNLRGRCVPRSEGACPGVFSCFEGTLDVTCVAKPSPVPFPQGPCVSVNAVVSAFLFRGAASLL